MGQTRLSSLSVINVHSEIACKLTLSNLIEIVAKKKGNLNFLNHLLNFMRLRFIFYEYFVLY